jgi:hypothetical protein
MTGKLNAVAGAASVMSADKGFATMRQNPDTHGNAEVATERSIDVLPMTPDISTRV